MIRNKIILSILFLCLINLIFLIGCSNKNDLEEDTKNKIVQELEYLDTQIISILNQLNNISLQNYNVTSEEVSLGKESGSSGSGGSSQSGQSSQGEQKQSSSQSESGSSKEKSNITVTQMEPKTVLESDENDIDWKTIKNEIEIINNAWAVIVLDLSSLNVDSNDILGFSNTLDDCILSIKNENKVDSLTNLTNLYSFIPKYETFISAPNNNQNIKQVKEYIIRAYSFVEQDNWSEIESNINKCEETFKNILNDIEYIKNKEYKVNKIYVSIKEMQNSLTYKDKKLFYIKYKTLLESMNSL
ncbi:MAG: hypothetical protein Q4G09_00620 [Clostridia bacterium]|nr:hypothetical protein [Clostridia bacterium]